MCGGPYYALPSLSSSPSGGDGWRRKKRRKRRKRKEAKVDVRDDAGYHSGPSLHHSYTRSHLGLRSVWEQLCESGELEESRSRK